MKIRALPPCSALLALMSALACMPAFPQPGTSSRIPTVTRLVKQFYELETTLDAKLAARDAAGLDVLLDANFETRRGAMPGAPMPRNEWLQRAAGAPAQLRIDQMAVHDFGTVAVVSFMQIDADRKQSSKGAKQRMIVDCWTRSGDRWLLTVRYEGESSPASAGRDDKRPTGRR